MEKLIALIIIVAIMAIIIVPYVIGVIKSFQAHVAMFCPLYSSMLLLIEADTRPTDKHLE